MKLVSFGLDAKVPDLILIPTQFERERLEPELSLDTQRWTVHTVGFGVIAAGIETSILVQEYKPERVVLAGIAGLFKRHSQSTSDVESPHRVGSACWFGSIMIDGIGIGRGDAFTDAVDLGWQWTLGDNDAKQIDCDTPDGSTASLLTVCAGSANVDDADWRSARYPDAVGEDMEAYAVAFACQRHGVSCEIVRGFSNEVGQRDKSRWRIDEALSNVSKSLRQRLSGYSE